MNCYNWLLIILTIMAGLCHGKCLVLFRNRHDSPNVVCLYFLSIGKHFAKQISFYHYYSSVEVGDHFFTIQDLFGVLCNQIRCVWSVAWHLSEACTSTLYVNIIADTVLNRKCFYFSTQEANWISISASMCQVFYKFEIASSVVTCTFNINLHFSFSRTSWMKKQKINTCWYSEQKIQT